MPHAHLSSSILAALTPGSVTIANRYVLDREIGRGGAGIVYQARDLTAGERLVAVKVLRPEVASAVAAARFEQEVSLLAKLQHPNLLPVFDSGRWDDLPFFVSPYLDGNSLRTRIREERQLALDEALDIVRQVGAALHYTHSAGVLHRDIKPENILLSDTHAALADFGIAYALERAGGDRLTSSQLVLGTPAYMSPEQAAGERALDPRSDQYSFACVAYEMLAGVPPFVGATRESVIGQRFTHAPMPLRAHRPMVPEQLERAIARALSIAPADRFDSIATFVSAMEAGARAVAAPSAKRSLSWRIWAGAAITAATLGTATFVTITRRAQPSDQRPGGDLHRIGVATFAALGGAGSSELAGGLGDQIAAELGRVSALTVMPPASIPACTRNDSTCHVTLGAQNIGAVVRGSVQRRAGLYEAAVQFSVGAPTGDVVRNERYEVADSSLSRAQHELATRIALSLRRWLGSQSDSRRLAQAHTTPRARELVRLANAARDDAAAIADLPATEDLPTAFASRSRADSLAALARKTDPAWPEPALVRGWIAHQEARLKSGPARVTALRRGIALADSALTLDTSSARARELRGALGWSLISEFGPQADSGLIRLTERMLRDAIARDSSRATARVYLSSLLALQGHVGETERVGRRAIELDAFLEVATDAIYRAFYNANLSRDSASAAQWCDYGRQTAPDHWRFMQCALVLMRRNALRPGNRAIPGKDSAWRIVAAMDRVDPPAKAAASGRAYYAIFRRMAAAAVSARAGDRRRALAEIDRAHRDTAHDPELQLDLLYDESILRHALGEDRVAAAMVQRLIDARPLERRLILRDPLFDWFPRTVINAP